MLERGKSPLLVSESLLAQYRLKGALETSHTIMQNPQSVKGIEELIQAEREPFREELDNFSIADTAHLDVARKLSKGSPNNATSSDAKNKRMTIHAAIGRMQALRDLSRSGTTPEDLHQKYQQELTTLENAAGPVSVKNSMWNVQDRVVLPIEPLQRGYDLYRNVSIIERKRINGIRWASYLYNAIPELNQSYVSVSRQPISSIESAQGLRINTAIG